MGATHPSSMGINHWQRPAIIVSLLLQNGADMLLLRFPSDLQTDKTHQMTGVRLVDQKTIKLVINEFKRELMPLA